MEWLNRIYSDLYNSQADQIYDAILTRIFLGHTLLGHRIMESQIARQLSVGISQVHEAMIRLRDEGWIELIPHGGARVVDYHNPLKHRQLYEMRLSLESGIFYFLAQTMTAAQAAELEPIVSRLERAYAMQDSVEYRRQDAEFHMAAAFLAGGSRLKKIYRSIFMQWCIMMDRCRRIGPTDQRTWNQAEKSHRAIHSALKSKDSSLAAQLVRQHFQFPECQLKQQKVGREAANSRPPVFDGLKNRLNIKLLVGSPGNDCII